MKDLNPVSKIFMMLAVLSGVLWFGGYLARLTGIYQLFKGPYFHVNYYITQQNLPGILISLNSLLVLTDILFIIFIISFFMFLYTSKINLKQKGWLFIITMIIIITLPFEAYLMSIDYKIYNLIISNSFKASEVLTLYVARMKSLSSFPIIEIICYGAIIFLLTFRPLNMNPKLQQ